MLNDLLRLIPGSLKNKSGQVFYSGRLAFSEQCPIYILGLNPGGSPVLQASETVAWHTNKVLTKEEANWSAYRDESWRRAAPGTHGMQPRVLHLLKRVQRDPGHVPASNVVFMRSDQESDIRGEFKHLASVCWPFHETVIRQLGVRVVVCFGKTAGRWVRQCLEANTLIATYTENNDRKWQSHSYRNQSGVGVAVLTHPGRADWTNSLSDPTGLVVDLLNG